MAGPTNLRLLTDFFTEATDAADLACRFMSASLGKRQTCCIAMK
jgi:hypothetical protein